MKKLVFISIFALLINACANEKNDNVKSKEMGSKKPPVASEVKEKYKIMFFLNPNGAPCQMQNKILNNMGNELTSRAAIEYVSTMELAASRPLFVKYGIRALPSMIVLDKDGNIHHRFTPGIQSAETILSKIGG